MLSSKNRRTHNRSQSLNNDRRNTVLLLSLFLSIRAYSIAAESTILSTYGNSGLAYRGNWARTGSVKPAGPKTVPIEHHHRTNVTNHP